RPRRAARTRFADEPFDVIHVFRLAIADRVRALLTDTAGSPAWHLDLDDVESSTHGRLAELYERTERPSLASAERQQAHHALAAEEAALRAFDRIYVCSEGDRLSLVARSSHEMRATIYVLPNALAESVPLPPPPADAPFTFLFIGTLSYAPNEDAIVWFCR